MIDLNGILFATPFSFLISTSTYILGQDLCLDSSLSILLNGTTSDWFQPSRGICQGDPLSSYLFILCMEYLSLRIEHAIQHYNWKPIRIGRNYPNLSRVSFVDDVMIFEATDSNTLSTMKETLRDFYARSGQKISIQKSHFFVSKNVSEYLRHFGYW